MTSEMVERVARAMRANAERSPEEYTTRPQEIAEHLARVAITAMREPTPDMVLAAVNTHPKDLKLGACIPTARWQAMVDEALK